MIRKRFDAGRGRVYVLSKPDEWRRLAPSLRRIVPPSLRKAWEAFPASFVEKARRARHPGLRRWLTACIDAPCHLHIYDTKEFGRTALLAVQNERCLLDFRTAQTRTRVFPPSSPKTQQPRIFPAALAEVYRAVGGIQYEFGCSGALLPPDALRPLPKCWGYDDPTPGVTWTAPTGKEAQEHAELVVRDLRRMREELRASGQDVSMMTDEWLEMVRAQAPVAASALGSLPLDSYRLENWLAHRPGGLSFERASRMIPFFEDSGDFLCFDAKGKATWIGWETGGVMPFGTVGSALSAFFDSLLNGHPFTSAFEPLP